MTEQIKEIFKAQETAKKAKLDFEQLVRNYITENVDSSSWKSLDNAIMELPECQAKLSVYDMMYDLKEEKKDNDDW